MYDFIDGLFLIVDYRFFWLPEYTTKFNLALNNIQGFYNSIYIYCNFNQLFASINELFNNASEEAQGRMYSRILSAITEQWWYRTNCIVDGFLGENFYDVGYCSGKLFTVVFDVSLA